MNLSTNSNEQNSTVEYRDLKKRDQDPTAIPMGSNENKSRRNRSL